MRMEPVSAVMSLCDNFIFEFLRVARYCRCITANVGRCYLAVHADHRVLVTAIPWYNVEASPFLGKHGCDVRHVRGETNDAPQLSMELSDDELGRLPDSDS